MRQAEFSDAAAPSERLAAQSLCSRHETHTAAARHGLECCSAAAYSVFYALLEEGKLTLREFWIYRENNEHVCSCFSCFCPKSPVFILQRVRTQEANLQIGSCYSGSCSLSAFSLEAGGASRVLQFPVLPRPSHDWTSDIIMLSHMFCCFFFFLMPEIYLLFALQIHYLNTSSVVSSTSQQGSHPSLSTLILSPAPAPSSHNTWGGTGDLQFVLWMTTSICSMTRLRRYECWPTSGELLHIPLANTWRSNYIAVFTYKMYFKSLLEERSCPTHITFSIHSINCSVLSTLAGYEVSD